ncbi:MAG: hypothetical protein JRG91_07170 [Deltaproteobacteria bacterium]|nr:hypothetical protein [Deltaproteobacteria bacterium]
MDGLTTPLALTIAAGAILVGLVVVAVALLQQAGALKRLLVILDDMRQGLQILQDNQAHHAGEKLAIKRRKLELAERDREPGLVVRMRGTLTLLEDSQEFKASYFILVMGSRRVLADRIKAVLVNTRDPDLSITLDALGGFVLEPGQAHEGEVTVAVRDLARINLPFVPEFKFFRESCRMVLSVEYEGVDGKTVLVERDLLER